MTTPRIVQHETLSLVGMLIDARAGDPQTFERISSLWNRFNEALKDVPPGVSYGVCIPRDANSFSYVAARPRWNAPPHETMQAGMVDVTIPHGRYAVFEHQGRIQDIRQSYDAAEQWLKSAGEKRRDGPTFERYDERFNPNDGLTEIYFPLR